MKQVILVTGASSGFGAMSARALADAGHVVYASMRETAGRKAQGLVLWVGSTSTRGGTPPYLAPYFAAKAAMDAVAVSDAGELAPWGIETTIIVPGAFTKGTNHFAHSGAPVDEATLAAYEAGPTHGLGQRILAKLAGAEPFDADPTGVARAIVAVADTPHGRRPLRVRVDPADDGCEVVNAVADRVRAEFLRRVDLADLLSPASATH